MTQVVHFNVGDMNSYITGSDYQLFKLHGSINWGRELEGVVHPGNNVPYPYQNLIDTVRPGSPNLTQRYRLCNRDMGPTPDPCGGIPSYIHPRGEQG